jgi:hypothetical protein
MNRRIFAGSILGASLAATLDPRSAAVPIERLGARTFSYCGKEDQPFLRAVEAQLALHEGAGYLNHMWFGGAFAHYLKLMLRIYVDGEATPSVEMDLGMGAGIGFEDPTAPWGTKHFGLTGEPSGIFYNYKIPFSKSVRVTAQLPEGVPRDQVFWWIVRGLENLPLQVCGFELPPSTRLKLHRRENLVAQPLELFDLAQVPGTGLVFQTAIAARSTNLEFLEGQMRAYFGADSDPQFLSSGLEDYFLGTYYFNRGLYHFAQAGLTHKNETNSSFSAYRVHEEDPLVFSNGIRLACRCGERRGNQTFGTTGKPGPTTYTTYVWTYSW